MSGDVTANVETAVANLKAKLADVEAHVFAELEAAVAQLRGDAPSAPAPEPAPEPAAVETLPAEAAPEPAAES